MAVPVLLRQTIGGTCDSRGALTIKSIVPSRSFFAVFTLALRATQGGNPQWTLDLSQAPMASGAGVQVTLGPIYMQPQEALSLTVTGAASGAVINGQLYGFLYDSPEMMPQSPPGLGGSVTVQAPPTASGRYTITAGAGTIIATGGASLIGLQVDATGAPTVTVAGSIDPSASFAGLPFYTESANRWVLSTTLGAGGLALIPCAGFAYLFISTTQTVAVTVFVTTAPFLFPMPGQTTSVFSLPVVLASDQSAVPVSPTFASNARTAFAATANGVASVAAEAMMTLVPVRAGVAGGGVTSIAVTGGKKLRLTAIVANAVNAAAAVAPSRFYLRTNPSGAVIATSPILCIVHITEEAAVAALGKSVVVPLPDGFEFSGTDQVGVSHVSTVATNVEWLSLMGFEY